MVDPKEECLVTEDELIRVDDGATSPSSSPSSCTSISIAGDSNKRCTHCNTTTTPLWRGGPAGPKTLCNACGIKHRKKRRAMEMGNNSNIKPQKLKITHKNNNNKAISKKSDIGGNGSGSVVNLVRTETTSNNGAAAMTVPPVKITNRVLKKHNSSGSKKSDNGGLERSLQSKKMGEEKRAALLLMALSCGSVSRFERKERKLLKELGII